MEVGDGNKQCALLSSIVSALTQLLEVTGCSEDSLITPGKDFAPEGAFFWSLKFSLLPRLMARMEDSKANPNGVDIRPDIQLLMALNSDLDAWKKSSRSEITKLQLGQLRESINRLMTGFY